MSIKIANDAFKAGKYKESLEIYLGLINLHPSLDKILRANIEIAKKRINLQTYLEYSPLSAVDNSALDNSIAIFGNASEMLNPEQLYQYDILKKYEINWNNYFEINTHKFASNDPVADYVINWQNSLPIIENHFDTEYYLEAYPDIKEAGIMPLLHFVQHGDAEGRKGQLSDDCIRYGKLKYHSEKETVVLITHESSASGAPLLGYSIADNLKNKYNIIHIILKKSNINDAFLNNCDLMVSGIEKETGANVSLFLKKILKTRPIKCCIINSIVGYKAMYEAYKLNLPILFLIHEFAEYMRPVGTMADAVVYSDVVLTPALIIENSIIKEFSKTAGIKYKTSNMFIRPQGKLPYIPDTYGDDNTVEELYKLLGVEIDSDVKIIVGSGWVQIRKGVDLFIAVAKIIKKLYSGKCKFVWVGEGFDPVDDLAYSVYLEREIEYSGLNSDLIFLEHQKNLDKIFSIADVFCLTSRMDPFPNVAIDALSHDLHIAAFDHGSGTADFLRRNNANATIVDFLDVYEMGKSISVYLQGSTKKDGLNKNIATTQLSFNSYTDYIEILIEKSKEFRLKSSLIVEKLLESELFDPNFCGGFGTLREKCRRYVENGLKGIHFYNPKIGFSELSWIEDHSKENLSVVPLYEAMITGNTETHKVMVLKSVDAEAPILKYAVHLHLFYIELTDYFVEYFKKLPIGYDIYITHHIIENKYEILEKFKDCGANRVEFVCVSNSGRDIAPLIFDLKSYLMSGQYEVIGHFHSKKSLDSLPGFGGKWLDFLMDTLIGDEQTANNLLSIFKDPEIGLVFAEDTNTIDIGENTESIEKLCGMLGYPKITQTPLFPSGNMFWARVKAIEEMFSLDPKIIRQPEPLPYDGTYLHALERITPYMAKSNGFQFVTVHREGVTWK